MSIVNNSQAKTQEENINFVAVRSFLGGNVDTLLENLAARRENDKNDSVDIFAAHTSPSINWKNVHTKTKLQILIEEKNALGLYMSGKPLEEYIELEKWLQKKFKKNLRLMFVNKVRKIFTKTGMMMFALEVSLTDMEIEAVIFPKNALDLSPILAENELFLCLGNVQEKGERSKKKGVEEIVEEEKPAEQIETNHENDDEMENIAPPVENSYQEKPKLLIENMTKYVNGPAPLLDSNLASQLPDLDWKMLTVDLQSFFEELKNPKKKLGSKVNSQKSAETASEVSPQDNSNQDENKMPTVKLSKKLGHFALEIKNNLAPKETESSLEIELWLMKDGDYQKARGTFWLPIKIWEKYQNMVN